MQNIHTAVIAAHLEREERLSKHLEEGHIRRQLAQHPGQKAPGGRRKARAVGQCFTTDSRAWLRRAAASLCHLFALDGIRANRPLQEVHGER